MSVSTESECSAGQGYPPTWKLRKYGIPVSLSQDTSVWWSGDIFSAMRATLSADRVMDHFENHNEGKAVTNHHLRAEQVVDWATRGGAKAIGLDSVIGSVEEGKKADLVLIKNDDSPVSFPILHPYGHVVYQAQRGDVHTVVVNGQVVKGAVGMAGELGHMVVKLNGRVCPCGRRGCAEAYAGRAAMEERARHLYARGQRTKLFELMEKAKRDRLSSSIWEKALAAHDPLARDLPLL